MPLSDVREILKALFPNLTRRMGHHGHDGKIIVVEVDQNLGFVMDRVPLESLRGKEREVVYRSFGQKSPRSRNLWQLIKKGFSNHTP